MSKLALPVVALALLATQGKGSGGLFVASLVGLAMSLALVALALQKFVLLAPKESS